MPRAVSAPSRLPLLLLPLAALIAALPMFAQGDSCGHDFVFHLQSWLDVATQLRHGTLYPHWAFTPAWNAGEPRFLFYPPISWLLGSLLTLLLPISAAPIAYVCIALTAAAFTMYRLARQFVPVNAAVFAAILYTANPYMLFNAYERSAFAELLAAAWIPLLLLAILRERPTVRGIAIPITLLWLTNAPAAVMGCYTFALVACLRAVMSYRRREPVRGFIVICIAGTALGLALPAFYLLPAAYEQRYVQVAMAVIPNMRFEDNFLFAKTGYAFHDFVVFTISKLCLYVIGATLLVFYGLWRTRHRQRAEALQTPSWVISALAVTAVVVAMMLVRPSTPIWRVLPELAFLQFPWRLMSILSPVLALALGMLLARVTPAFTRLWVAALPCALLLCTLGLHRNYGNLCEATDRPAFVQSLYNGHHGEGPTDEYTPTNADNDLIRTDSPAYWTAPTLNAYGPNTLPNPNATDPNYDQRIPDNATVSAQAPRHLELDLPQPATLVLNLRDFPAWAITRNGSEHLTSLRRDDGLIALALPAGHTTLDIAWHRSVDQQMGLAVSGCALLAFALTFRRKRFA